MKRFLTFLLAVAILLPVCAAAETVSPEPTAEPSPLDQQVHKIFKAAKTLGGEVVIAKDGKIIYQYVYGYSNKKKNEPVTPDHYYRLASVSKLISGVVTMRLVETGQLDLDENIGTILGGDEPFFAGNPKYPDIGFTTRMIMTHTSSIWDTHLPTQRPLRQALNIEKTWRGFFYEQKPGTAYHYSDYAVGILGCIWEAITGKRLSTVASELVFDPMGLDAAYAPALLKDPEKVTSRFSRPYSEEINIDEDYYITYGGCWMKCTDLCKIGMMLADYGMFEGKRILEEDTVREMISSQEGKGGITAKSPYGLNVARISYPEITSDPEHLIYGHQGRINSVLCNLYFDPETRFVFAMVTNECSPGGKAHGVRTPASALLELLWKEFNQ